MYIALVWKIGEKKYRASSKHGVVLKWHALLNESAGDPVLLHEPQRARIVESVKPKIDL